MINAPTINHLKGAAGALNLRLSDAELEIHLALMAPTIAALQTIAEMADDVPSTPQRDPGRAPDIDGNVHNAWAWQVSVPPVSEGALNGHRVVLKDNIALAGVPMVNGTSTLKDYVPEFDATVVTRILEAGGEIVGKARCEQFCLSGGSHTSFGGPVRNPHDAKRSSGGSSSGCGALVGAGEIAMAIGGDQGGSIRIPSSWSGCVGMKPTWGLVPYSGIMAIEATIDHTGPITDTVANNALLLSVIAGPDGLDPRQFVVPSDDYLASLDRGVTGLRIGLVDEGFGRAESEPDVDELVRTATCQLVADGASVANCSLPWHDLGGALWPAIALEGLTQQMMLGNGTGYNWKGLYSTSLLEAHSLWPQKSDELAPTLHNSMLLGQYLSSNYRGALYARAQNIARRMRRAYDALLDDFDILVVPTTPMKATLIPPADAPIETVVARAFEMIGNTAPVNVTGHPALSLPCGFSAGLPVGLMMIGRHLGEATLYAAAAALERRLSLAKSRPADRKI